MKQEIREFLNLREKPKILTMEQAAAYLGIAPHYLPLAARQRIVLPLAARWLNPNCTKFYARADLDALSRQDLERLIRSIVEYNRERNSKDTAENEEHSEELQTA